ncbi:MAG: molybdopterin molybdotransferase MoeA [Gammaproteobacteria bacterium]
MTRTTDLISVDEAQRLISEHVHLLPVETLAVAQCAGRVLRQSVMAERDQPPFDRATMDGIALSSTDPAHALRVTGIGAAGAPPVDYAGAGSCVEIMTGAVVPKGCDVVVPVERIQREGDTAIVRAEAQREPNTFVHQRGSDHAAGHELLQSGARINATRMAVLVSAGCANPSVTQAPRIAVLATGDELVDVNQPVAPHQIRRSNDYALQTLLAQHGWTHATRHHVTDDRATVGKTLNAILAMSDVLVISGGVSKGRYDFVADELAAAGVRKVFHRIAQRPGKPMWFGVGPQQQLVFALPGNPVSALVCLRRYVIPALRQQSGLTGHADDQFAVLDRDVSFKPALSWFAAATRRCDQGTLRATVHPVNTSGDFTALADTDGLLEFPANESEFGAGTVLPWHPW